MTGSSNRNNESQTIRLRMTSGDLISEKLIAAGEHITLPCNGRGSCGKCRALVSGDLEPPTDIELQHLSPEDLAAGMRLTCQARARGGEVSVSSWPKTSDFAILVEGYSAKEAKDPNLEVKKVNLAPSVPADLSEWDRLGVGQDYVNLDLIRSLPEVLNRTGSELQLAHFAERLVSIRSSQEPARYFGVAFDIGTTTLVGYLVNLRSGRVVNAMPRSNPQAAHGADVMSRIGHATTPEGLAQLRTEITSAISDIVRGLAQSQNIPLADIVAISAVGNTCMHHLLLGLPPYRLGQSPYLPIYRHEILTTGAQLLLPGLVQTLVWTGPIIGGFVGSDAVAAAIAGELLADEQPRLLVDLGTNGEILLAGHGRILACSAAAGPAFEGVQISCGMRAEPGAIDGVSMDSDGVKLQVLGDSVPPRGLCGSGLIDTVAELVRMGAVDETGRFVAAEQLIEAGHRGLAEHLVDTGNGTVFRLVDDVCCIDLTQGDIREVQLAKAAIRAAIEVCCLELGISSDQISDVVLAGAFGTYIRKDNAMRIGLLPEVPLRRIRSIGNAAGAGAVLALTSRRARVATLDLANRAEHVDLGGHPLFQERFVDAMLFTG